MSRSLIVAISIAITEIGFLIGYIIQVPAYRYLVGFITGIVLEKVSTYLTDKYIKNCD